MYFDKQRRKPDASGFVMHPFHAPCVVLATLERHEIVHGLDRRRVRITFAPGTSFMWTNAGVEKSPDLKAFAMPRMCARMVAIPFASSLSRWSSMRPPSGSASNLCVDVY